MKFIMFILLGGFVITSQAKMQLHEIVSPEEAKAENLYLKLVVDKDNNLVVSEQSEIPSGQCDLKTKKVMISINQLTSAELKKLKCNIAGSIRPLYHLTDFTNALKKKNIKKIYLEPIIIPYLNQSTPPLKDFARLIDRFLRKNDLLKKTYIVSKSLKFLRVLKGQVNKEHKIIYKNAASHPDYLHFALYYNLYGIMPHYQWIYDEDLKAIKKNDKRLIEVILWGEITPYIKDSLLKKQADGILLTQ